MTEASSTSCTLITIGYVSIFLINSLQAQDLTGEWSQWTSCNAECGTGITSRARPCTSLSVQRNCAGDELQFKACNRQKCSGGKRTLKEIQCASHNGEEIRSRKYNWQPYTLDESRCVLTCSAIGFGFYKTFSTMTNGTICNKEGTAVCVDGECKKFGCDGVINSRSRLDTCGVCGGDGSTCQIFDEVYSQPKLDYGYNKIGTIPAGARNINITQLRRSRNYLALKEKEGEYIINGHRRLSRDGKFDGVGTHFRYHRRHLGRCPGECIVSKGPTSTDLDIMVLAFSHNPGIVYQYSLPHDLETSTLDSSESSSESESLSLSKYEAIIIQDDFKGPKLETSTLQVTTSFEKESDEENFGSDSEESSGNGEEEDIDGNKLIQTAYNVTIGSDGRTKVSRIQTIQQERRVRQPPSLSGNRAMPGYTQSFRFIDRMINKHKNNDRINSINSVQADKNRQNNRVIPGQGNRRARRGYSWKITGYTPCNKPCGTGTKKPFIECRFNRRRVSESYCRDLNKPSENVVPCNTQSCRGMWQPSDWSACSVTCGRGTQSRTLTCVYQMAPTMYAQIEDSDCNGLPRPDTTQICQINDCNQWQADQWTTCSVSCGTGRKSRRVFCQSEGRRVRDDFCNGMEKPMADSECDMGNCERTSSFLVSMRAWYFTEWTDTCPVDCGAGKQTRKVLCLGEDINTDPTKSCTVQSKPESYRECKSSKRCQPQWFTGPWNKCNTSCGDGYQSRDVVCVRKESVQGYSVVPDYFCVDSKPEYEKQCNLPRCPAEWYTSDWGECSVTCGNGRKSRNIMCVDDNGQKSANCPDYERPQDQEECRNLPCRFESRNSVTIERPVSDKYRPQIPPNRRTGVVSRRQPTKTSDDIRRTLMHGQQNRQIQQQNRQIQQQNRQLQQQNRQTQQQNRQTQHRKQSTRRNIQQQRRHHRQQQRTRSQQRRQRHHQLNRQRHQTTGSRVQGEQCRDQYNKCDMIKEKNLCGHYYYGKLCCETCNS